MVLLIIAIVILLIGIILWKFDDYLGFLITLVGAFSVVIMLLIGCCMYSETYNIETDRMAIIESIQALTTNGEIEHVSLDGEIINFNKRLREYQKLDKNIFINFGIVNDIQEIEPILEYR